MNSGCTTESPSAPVVNVPLPTPPTRSLESRSKLVKSYPAGTRRLAFLGISKTKRVSLLGDVATSDPAEPVKGCVS